MMRTSFQSSHKGMLHFQARFELETPHIQSKHITIKPTKHQFWTQKHQIYLCVKVYALILAAELVSKNDCYFI